MPLTFAQFRDRFDALVDANGIDWEVVGFISPSKQVYPFGTDTKVLSTVFELLASPIVKEIADENGYALEGAAQTIYPDFTLTPNGGGARIAIDVKTTYRKFKANGEVKGLNFTLGSYTSFLRSPGAVKNIKYPYQEYSDHWVIGFVYTRRVGVDAKVIYDEDEIDESLCPYENVEYFIQEKHKIAGLKPGSGNTANIGSFSGTIVELREGRGPFSTRGKDLCDRYWKNYPSSGKRPYNSIETFLTWEKNKR